MRVAPGILKQGRGWARRLRLLAALQHRETVRAQGQGTARWVASACGGAVVRGGGLGGLKRRMESLPLLEGLRGAYDLEAHSMRRHARAASRDLCNRHYGPWSSRSWMAA